MCCAQRLGESLMRSEATLFLHLAVEYGAGGFGGLRPAPSWGGEVSRVIVGDRRKPPA
jgi:hypothetical protein